MTHCIRRAAFLFVLSALARAAGQAWVVDKAAGPGHDFTEIQAAVAAAADRDTIFVKPPPTGQQYASFTIDGKGLTVFLSSELPVTTAWQYFPKATVRNVAAPSTVVIRGFRLQSSFPDPFDDMGQELEVRDCTGDVWIENSSFHQGVLVANSPAVLFARCSLIGARAYGCLGAGGTGLLVQDSGVHLLDSAVRGGAGADVTSVAMCMAGDGGDGVILHGGFLFSSGSVIKGGAGGKRTYLAGGCDTSGSGTGGDGLVLASGTPFAELLDTQLLGGVSTCPWPLVTGSPSILLAGALNVLPGPSRSLSLGSPVKEGQALPITIEGVPGDLAFWGLSASQDQLYFPPFLCTLALGHPISVFFAGLVPASGTIGIVVPIGELGPGVESYASYMQGGFLTPAFEIRLGSPSVALLLDQAF